MEEVMQNIRSVRSRGHFQRTISKDTDRKKPLQINARRAVPPLVPVCPVGAMDPTPAAPADVATGPGFPAATMVACAYSVRAVSVWVWAWVWAPCDMFSLSVERVQQRHPCATHVSMRRNTTLKV
jgi:hypothetical protein